MQNNDNQKTYFIYVRSTGEKVPATKEQHDSFYKEADRIRHKEQDHGRCMCPYRFIWKCDGDCIGCEYHAAGDITSLDQPLPDGNGTLGDYIPDRSKPMEEVIADRMLLEQLFARLRELDPEADTIIQLWKDHPEGISDRAIARELGRPQKTFADQMKKYRTNLRRITGDTKDENGNLVIDPEQAEIVKRIYREYLEGSSMDKIASGLMADGILTGAGKEKWHTSTINKILRNEKYMGDALLQKTYTTDFLTKKRIKNNGTVPQYYVEGDHEAIIPKDLFMQVQAELVRRRVVHVSPTGKKRSFSCNHCFAQMVFCGDCGELYRRVHWNNHGCKSIVWRCISRLEPGSADTNCTNRTVNELLLQEVTVTAINQILTERGTFLKQLQANIAKAVVSADTLSPDGIQARLEELQKELIKKANNKQDYDAIADEILRLREQKKQSEVDSHHREEAMNRIKELQDFIAGQETDITEFDEALVKKLIEKITIFADHFTVEFKSGITIEIEA